MRESKGSRRGTRTAADAGIDSNGGARSKWSLKPLAYGVLAMITGFVLASAGASSGILLLSGILLWVVGVLSAVYCIVRRLAGPGAAKLAVGVLLLILITKFIFGERDD